MLEQSTQGRRIHGLDAAEREAARREQIVESAWTVFAEAGYAATSVEHVCARANVSTKSFYRIFENREHLYLALYEEFLRETFDRLAAVSERARRDPTRSAGLFMDALVGAHFDDPRKGMVVLGPQRAVTPAVERTRRDAKSTAAQFLMAVWRERGRDDETSGIAVATIGGLFDLLGTSMVDAEPLTDQQIGQLRADLGRFYNAVAAGLSALAES